MVIVDKRQEQIGICDLKVGDMFSCINNHVYIYLNHNTKEEVIEVFDLTDNQKKNWVEMDALISPLTNVKLVIGKES